MELRRNLAIEEYLDKVKACWMGKNIGGILGSFYEGVPQSLNLSFYDPVPQKVMPNDDLELQVVWLLLVEKYGLDINYEHFVKAWQENIEYGMDEYGVAIWNIRRGIKPPLTGVHNNWFESGMGAAIRSEIWACLFPGKPDIAAHFARLDSSVDHAREGVWAEMFLAAAESAAFVCFTAEEAVFEGLKVIPGDSRIARAINFVFKLSARKVDSARAREIIMNDFGSHNFTDCAMNIAFAIYSILSGQGDFGKTILGAVNCGMDTDCTGATSGAFMGILHGAGCIESRWTQAINGDITYSDFLLKLNVPKTIDDLTERVVYLSNKLNEDLTKEFVVDLSPLPEDDIINDGHRWLILTDAAECGQEPVRLTEVQQNRIDFTQDATELSGIHIDLSSYCDPPQAAIYLFTYLKVPVAVNGYLMVCADTGLTAWLDDEIVLNYHGRYKRVPACHRTEGGASIPVKLEPDRSYALKIRLLCCHKPIAVTVAVLDKNNQYIPGFEFSAKP